MDNFNSETLRSLILDLADLVSEDDDDSTDKPSLGFSDQMPQKDLTYFSLSAQRFRTGHLLIDDQEEPLPGKILRGHIKDVQYSERHSDQYGLSQSLRILIETDEQVYMMNSGLFATTSRNILSSLATANDPNAVYGFHPQKPPTRTDGGPQSDKVIFVDVYEDEQLLTTDYYPRADAEVVDLLVQAQEFFGATEIVDPNEVPVSDGGGGGYNQNPQQRQGQSSRQSQPRTSHGGQNQPQKGPSRSGRQGVSQNRRSTPKAL